MKKRKQKTDKAKKLPSPNEAVMVSRQVENPDWRPDRDGEPGFPRNTVAVINAKESAVETLFARGGLSNLQKRAADLFRAHYEAYASENIRSIDYSDDKVDTSTVKAPTTERRAKARYELGRCKAEIGTRNYRLLVSICGQGKSFNEMYPYVDDKKEDAVSQRKRLTAADNLRSSLYDTAVLWGLATGYSRKKH